MPQRSFWIYKKHILGEYPGQLLDIVIPDDLWYNYIGAYAW